MARKLWLRSAAIEVVIGSGTGCSLRGVRNRCGGRGPGRGRFAAVGGETSTSTGEGAWTRSAAPRSSWSSCASACPRSTCNRESRREVDDSSPSETSPEGAAALETAAVDPAAASTEGTGGASAARGSCPLTHITVAARKASDAGATTPSDNHDGRLVILLIPILHIRVVMRPVPRR